MKLLGKKKKPVEDEKDGEEKEERKQRKERSIPRKKDEPKDPTRWLPLLFLMIFLFISYLFWVAY